MQPGVEPAFSDKRVAAGKKLILGNLRVFGTSLSAGSIGTKRADIERIAHSLNTRPRAVLGFQTPEEVFMAELSKLGDALQI